MPLLAHMEMTTKMRTVLVVALVITLPPKMTIQLEYFIITIQALNDRIIYLCEKCVCILLQFVFRRYSAVRCAGG